MTGFAVAACCIKTLRQYLGRHRGDAADASEAGVQSESAGEACAVAHCGAGHN